MKLHRSLLESLTELKTKRGDKDGNTEHKGEQR